MRSTHKKWYGRDHGQAETATFRWNALGSEGLQNVWEDGRNEEMCPMQGCCLLWDRAPEGRLEEAQNLLHAREPGRSLGERRAFYRLGLLQIDGTGCYTDVNEIILFSHLIGMCYDSHLASLLPRPPLFLSPGLAVFAFQ